MKCTDPALLTPAERLDVIADILAVGAQRYFAAECKRLKAPMNSQNGLDRRAGVEAPCGPRVQSPQSGKPA